MVALTASDYGLSGASETYPDLCVHQLFEQQVERSRDAVAVVFGDRRLTYGELDRSANQVARFLGRRGVGPESLVGVCMRRTPELVVALLGIWKAGAAYVPLDPAYPQDRLSFMLGDAAIRMLLTDRSSERRFADSGVGIVCLDGADAPDIAREETSAPAVGLSPSSLAYVMYTSGSTGKPKGAMIVHSGLANYLCWAVRAYGVEAGGSVPVHSSIAFDLTVTSLYPALLAGGQIELLAEDVGAQNLLAALRRGPKRDLVKITPAHLDVITRQLRPEELAGTTRLFVIGGENLTAESLAPWRDFAPQTRLVNEYGPTETVVGCCVHEVLPEDPGHGSVSIGRPIANTTMYVLDERLQPAAAGSIGEIYIGGAGVARGYLNRPDLTRERFVPDPFARATGARMYKTGDLARRRADGTLEFLGRADDQVKVRGYRIELGEIEATLASHPAVQSCAVLAREDTPGNKQLVGYVVPRGGEGPTMQTLQSFLAERLPEYMVPPRFVPLASMPLTVNGKVDRNALPAPSEVETSAVRNIRTPRDETARAIAAIWCELLKVDEIGLDADFFELGGHSLAAVKALAMVQDALGVDVSLEVLFEHSTLEAFAAVVARTRGPAENVHRIPRRGAVSGPASFAQEQMWLLHQLAPLKSAYNILDAVPLRGPYDGRALHSALRELVVRHESLRTTFSYDSGELRQTVHPPFGPSVAEIDLGEGTEDKRPGASDRLVREHGRIEFDLGTLPLMRATVVHRSPGDHELLLTIHHVIADEWSMHLVHRELGELYEAFVQGRPPNLPPLAIQYSDYAAWQREWFRGDVLASQVTYWSEQLRGAPTALALPTDKPHPAELTMRGATEQFRIPGEVLGALQELCRQEQATQFMGLEAAFAALLHRITGQDDILVGTPISGRTQSETQDLVGCFLNTVVLRTRFLDDPSFRSLVQQVRGVALGAYAHADLPFDRLVAELSPAREPGRTPLFRAMFILHDRDGMSEVSNLSGDRVLHNGTSKFELTLFLSETADGMAGLVEYSTDLFEPETIRRLCRSYARLLEAVVHAPDQAIASLPMLAETDRLRLVSEWNDTSVAFEDGDRCLHELFARQAARTPDSTALVCKTRTLTYAELDRRSDELGRRLSRLGVGPDVLVGLLFERSLDMVVGLLGVLKAGGAYVPLDPSFPPDRLAHMIEDSRMPVLVTHEPARAVLDSLRARPGNIVQLDRDLEAGASADGPPKPAVDGRNLAYVLYTSGSTGLPKGVAISHAAIVNFLLSMQREPGLIASDTLLAVTTLSFDIAALELYLPLITGAKVVIASREDVLDPRRLMERMRESACTVMQATPSTWGALVEAGWNGVPRLKALCGGEAMPPALAQALVGRCAALWNMYGPTETTVWSTVHRITATECQPPIGHPIANTQVYVLDGRLDLVSPGVAGELYIGGYGLAREYLNRPELTQERFVASPFTPGARLYRTGDLARWRADGTLECLGRTDHQVKLRGYRIELGEIEACIARYPAVRQTVVVAREDTPGDKRLVAYVVPRDPGSDAGEALRTHLRQAVPDYMVPAHFVALAALPLTPNGKVDRKALPRPTSDATSRGSAYTAPKTALEMSLAAAWERVLGVVRVGMDDNFFELGGDSLKVLQLIVQMEQASGIQIDLGAVFKFPTLSALVKSLGTEAASAASMAIPLQPAGDGVPLFCLCGITLYQEFATSLGTAQRVFGVYVPEEQVLARDALRGAKVQIDIPRLARAYYEAIVRVAPKGPYRLAGSSFGGIVALEVASIMRQNGASVDLVALLDTLSPRGIRRNWVTWFYRRVGQVISREAGRKLVRELARFQDKLVARGWLPGNRDPEHIAEEAYALKQQAYFAAIGAWQKRRFVADYKVVLFRAKDHEWGPQDELDEDYGWRHYLTGPLSVVDLPGDHLGILREPHVRELGLRVREHLD